MNGIAAVLFSLIVLVGLSTMVFFAVRKLVFGTARAVRECSKVLHEEEASKLAAAGYSKQYIEQSQAARLKRTHTNAWRFLILGLVIAIPIIVMFPPGGLFLTFLWIFVCVKGINGASAKLRIAKQEEENAKYPDGAATLAIELAHPDKE